MTVSAAGQLAAPDASSPLMAALKANNRTLLTGGLTIGAGSDADRSANATISQLWLTTGAVIPCSAVTNGLAGLPGIPTPSNIPPGAVPIMIQELKSLEAANSQPIIDTISQTPSGDVFVGDSVRFDVVATDKDGDDLRQVLVAGGQDINEGWGCRHDLALHALCPAPLAFVPCWRIAEQVESQQLHEVTTNLPALVPIAGSSSPSSAWPPRAALPQSAETGGKRFSRLGARAT